MSMSNNKYKQLMYNVSDFSVEQILFYFPFTKYILSLVAFNPIRLFTSRDDGKIAAAKGKLLSNAYNL